MLSLRTVRRLCAPFDTLAITAIAAALCKPKHKSIFNLAAPITAPVFPPVARGETHLASAASTASTAAVSTNSLDPPPVIPSETNPGRHPSREPIPEPALVKLKKERDPGKLFLLFQSNAHNRLVVENRFTFEDTVSRLAGARRFDLIEQLLEQHKALPQGRREGFVIRIIMLYGKAGMHGHALRTFDEMHLYGCPRTVKSFNATLKVLCSSRSFEEVRTILELAPAKFGISLDEVSYNIIIKVLCEARSLESAYLALVEMEKAGIKPSVVTYTTLMAASYRHDRREVGDGLWNLMVVKGCSPNLVTFNVRIQYLITKNRAWQARSLMEKMVASGIKPDELTFNLIIKGFCRIGDLEMAKRIFMAMHGRGCKPNGRIYQTVVHFLCKAREFDLAFSLCKDSMEKNWFPNIETTRKLLEGLISISKDRNAREIMELVGGREPPYLVYELKFLQEIISPAREK